MTLAPYQLHTRIGLACVFASQAPTNALARVLREGDCEMLGGFSLIHPSDKRGWICRVSTRNGTARLLAIVINPTTRRHRVIEITRVPWEYWQGVGSERGWSPHSGDDPETNAESHRIAVALSEALRVGLSESPEPTTGGTPTPPAVAEAPASGPHIWNRALRWLRRNR